jgi:spermidine/putrescine transport system substrate-binding protein
LKRKLFALVLPAVLVFGLLSGCSTGTKADREVNVYNWGEYIDESIFEIFEEETGITVNYNYYESNEALYSMLKSGGVKCDVIIPSDYMISRLIEEGMLEKLNFENIPNYQDIAESYRNLEYDPQNEYSVPYMWGTVGIIYNTTMIDKPVTGWDIVFDPDYAGQILMFKNSRDTIGIALKYLGYSFNTTDKEQIREAVDLLISQRPLVQAYVMDQIFDKLENGEAAVGPYYAGDFITMHEANPALSFVVPEEGSNIFVDAMCIPKGAEHKAEGEAFINFMCRTDIGLANCETTGYSTPLLSVLSEMDPEMAENPVMYPPADVLARCESYVNLPVDVLELYDSEWIRLFSN